MYNFRDKTIQGTKPFYNRRASRYKWCSSIIL